MYTSTTLRLQYSQLDRDIAERFTELRNRYKFITFIDPDDEEAIAEVSSSIEYRGSSGATQDVIPITVSPDGITVVMEDEREVYKILGLDDLADLRDKLTLIEWMENAVNNEQ